MSDRDSSWIYGRFFESLAENPTDEHKAIAVKMWKDSLAYDFAPEDMHCDGALKKLGLACKGIDPEYPEDGATTVYANGRGLLARAKP